MTYVPAEQRYDEMPYRRCGRSGLDLPAISLGLWQNFGGADVFETGRAMLRRAFDLGVTQIDVSHSASTDVRPRRIQISTSGGIRSCDPAVTDAADPRICNP